MSSLGLNIGLQALLTSQAGLDTTGHNISNASTPGYSRQSVLQGPARAQQLRGLILGSGVQADVVARVTDELLNQRLVSQTEALGRFESRYDALSRMELLFSGLSDVNVGSALDTLFGALSNLSAAPADRVLRENVVQASEDLGLRLRELSGQVGALRFEFAGRVENLVQEVNVLAEEVGALNNEIIQYEAGGAKANDLRDQRQESLRQLAELVDVRYSEDPSGAARVLVGGHLLVSPGSVNELGVLVGVDGSAQVTLTGASQPVELKGGAIGGLFDIMQDFLPELAGQVDDYAHNLIFEFNKIHSTSVPPDSSFHFLSGQYSLQDLNGDGLVTDELLANAGLPFDVQTGDVYVRIVDEQTGAIDVHRVSIDAQRTTVGQFVADLNAINHMAATIDAQGRLQVSGATGYAFDFSSDIPSNPDRVGSLGGGHASLGTPVSEPFALNNGDTLTLQGASGPVTVTFGVGSFRNIGSATAAEIAAVINADPNIQAASLRAADVGGTLVLQSVGTGSTESFQVQGGTALAALGLTAGQVVTGSDQPTTVTLAGSYQGTANDQLVFRPNMDGTIGNTVGLTIDVLNSSGNLVTSLDVGSAYRPGDPIDLGNGLSVAFALGDVSATDNDVLAIEALADSDTSDVLAALGLNSFFTGSDANSIQLRQDLANDPSLLAASISGAPDGGGGILGLLALADREIPALGNTTLGEQFGALASGVGFEVRAAETAVETERLLLDGLQARRDQLSGVNIDEELVNMLEYEQAFTAASQFIRVISDVTNELLSIV